ncbi:MAG: DNA mismatch repair protein MutS [Lachnospiraceae bacterium]|nr:DNA mismatch repair protein MutS [Lachnospiraceae bacterium]MDN4742629.1 DNA mismatch repair protein MutS [Lachnospiraceae bacterium C1.1]
MMLHYIETKEKYPDCILFYRLGDFYEMFFDDALVVSKELEITLTGKSCGLDERAPMCGVPFHAVDAYLDKLVALGHKVAICEQLEDPKTTKNIVKRDVIRVVTPGTNMNMQALDEGKNNFLMSVVYFAGMFGLAVTDVTTGDFYLTEVENLRLLLDEISRYMPSEIIANPAFFLSGINIDDLRERLKITLNQLDEKYFTDENSIKEIKNHFNVEDLSELELADFDIGTHAAGALISYLKETQKTDLTNLTKISPYKSANYMVIDSSTRRNLELTETLREKNKRGSLLWVLDHTKTAMGARLLRSMIEQPLIDENEINARLDAVEELTKRIMDRDEIREYLAAVYDLERLLCKISYGSANPRDLIALKGSLKMMAPIRALTADFDSDLLKKLSEKIDALEDIYQLIENAIVDDPPLAQKEGGIIKDGYNTTVDELKDAGRNGKRWLAELEEREREKTGIKNLKVKFSKVFGYSIEVTNSYLSLVPKDYVRKQTLAGGERYITDELKKMEDTILNAEDRLTSLEYELFSEVRNIIGNSIERILDTAKAVAMVDVLQSLSYVADHNNFVRPKINTKGIINIKNGRHPVVEKMISGNSFVPNDVLLDQKKNMIAIITGPNMAGKSTYMRQCALIVLMAAIGSFVPAEAADISVVDRIFTRVGASDDLASGQSTFMVEMSEVANILRNATPKSLLILDEIGRGTSTYDGLSIAWAVVEYIANTSTIGAKTLFATHYHELTELEGKIPSVNNFCFAVKENGEDVVFLRKIVRGGADKSYGIHVAKLAGVPAAVIDRANEIVWELSDNDIAAKVRSISASSTKKERKHKMDEVDLNQMSFFDTMSDNDVLKELEEADISHMTPMDALNTLYKLQNELKNRWKAV